ncbi:hypothetical protein FS749_003628 [Ceratobasidium sp. UAMH 11750]|nr:hypothetical protein FS749_003628 [Ceratobasidium sp. UAMH 11750]
MDNSGYSSQGFGWETHAQAGREILNQQHFGAASSQPSYPSNAGSRRLSHQEFYNLAHEDQSAHYTTPASHTFGDSYTNPQPPQQPSVLCYGTHYTHQHSQRAHRYPHTQYQQPHAPSPSGQSSSLNPATPQPRVNVSHHPLRPVPANRFTPYGTASRPTRSERMADLTTNQYNVAEPEVNSWGYTDAAAPSAPEHKAAGGVDRSAPALPVASPFANLTLAQRGLKDEGPQPPVPPVAPVITSQRAQSPVIDASCADSSSDTIMPDASDLIPSKPANRVPSQSVPSQDKKKSSASALTAPSAQAQKAPKSTRSPKTVTQKAGDNVSNTWTIDHHDLLIRHILDSDENFKNAEKKGGSLAFWKRVSENIFENKRTPEALQQRWKELKGIYQQVKALESFTGGDGDGEFVIDGDDPEAVILDKLRGRLDSIHERKPNIDPQRKVKSPDVYWNWIRGGDESWYWQMHAWFRDSSTFERKHVRRSGSLSPLKIDSNTDDETTSKLNVNTPKRDVKSRAGKTEKGTRGLTGLDAAATAAKEFFAAQNSANGMKNNVAMERLKFEQQQAKVANELSAKTLEMRCETQKRKWSNDKRMAEIAEEDAKRR